MINTPTLYLDGYQYVNGNLEFFPVAGAYVKKTENIGATKRWYDYVFNYTDHLGNIRLSYTLDYNTNKIKILEENHYYPFGQKHRKYNNLLSDIQFKPNISNRGLTPIVKGKTYKYKYNGKELQDELGLNVYDYGARNYDASLGRWMNVDPLAEKFPNISLYNFVLNNPIRLVDPDGRAPMDIIGVTKSDAKKFKADVHNVLSDAKFENLRGLIDLKGKKFRKIDSKALTTALDGVNLSADEQAYVDIVVNTINSDDKHMVEYLSGEFTSSEGATAFKDHMNKIQAGVGDAMLTPEGNLSTGIIKAHGDGLNAPTKKGSHSFITNNTAGNDRSVTSNHEVFGHGIPSANGATPASNNANAIRTDNLVRRLLGLPQRDGSKHGGYKEGHITEPQKLPITQ